MSKFKLGQKVMHKSGKIYRITRVPDEMRRLEHGNRSFYAYIRIDIRDATEWYRQADEFEDGRFTEYKE